MEKKNTSVFYNALIWGVIIGLASIIYSVILYVFNQALNRGLGYAGLIITLGLLIYGTINYRDSVRGGNLPFGTAFGFGILVIMISAIISQIYSYLLFTVIDPGLQEKMTEMIAEQMLDRGLPEEQLDDVLARMEKFRSPLVMAISALVSSAIIGAIIALIVAAIFKREVEPEAEIEESTE